MNLEPWLPVIIAFATGTITPIVIEALKQRSQKKLTDAQAEGTLSEGWEKLGQGYSRLLENYKRLEVEIAELRPLPLKLALQGKEMDQIKEDKEDWKRYAGKLVKQLEEANLIPLPFRRYPGNGDSDKIKAITREKIEAIKVEEQQ
jgi:hypothetical protein